MSKKLKGSITVLLVIILIPCILLSGIIVDTSRVNMIKAEIASAGDLAMNSALANYDTILKDVYGLFAMSQNETPEEMKARIRDYFEKTLVSYGVTNEESAGNYLNSLLGDFNSLIGGTPSGDIKTLLGVEVPANDFTIVRPERSALSNPDVMRKQIVDYMKFRGPINFGLSIFDAVKSFTTIQDQSAVVEKQVAAQESMQDVTEGCKVTIEGIREYDRNLKEINDGSMAARGVLNHSDGNPVPVMKYKEQLYRYRLDEDDTSDVTKWDASYERINRLIMCFLLKAPKTSSMYLKDQKNYQSTSYFVTENGINTGGSGVSVGNYSLNNTLDSAVSQFESQRTLLAGNPYKSNAQKYVEYDFVKQSYVNVAGDNIVKETEASAIECYVEYEKFVQSAEGAKVKYSDIKPIFEELLKLHKFYENAQKYLVKAEEDAKKEMDKAKEAYDKANSELESMKKAKEAAEAAAKAASSTPGSSGKKSKSTPSSTPSGPSQQEISAKESEVAQLLQDYNSKSSTYDKAVAEKENNTSHYKETCSQYASLCTNYIQDLNEYDRYQKAAETAAVNEITWIYNQFSQINSNLLWLTNSLETTAVNLGTIKAAVDEYDSKVADWSNANQSYTNTNGNDTFSAANKSEIDSSHKNIDKKQVDSLILYVDSIAEEYRILYNAINDVNSENFKYGGTKIFYIASLAEAENVAKKKKDSLPEFVTKTDADNMFKEMYKEPVIEDVFCDLDLFLSLVDPKMIDNSFLQYLNATYPPEEEATAEQKEGKAQYDQLLDNIKSDNSGESINDGDDYTANIVDGGESDSVTNNPLNYTYSGKSVPTANLPSADYAVYAKDKEAKTLALGTNGDKIEASGGVSAVNSGASSILSGIGNIASTSLENIYIINYIFENFSYNTMMQELILDGEGIDKDANVEPIKAKSTLNDSSVTSKYLDKAVTLSNIPKNANNNFLYGAEIEYIVYGNTDAARNVTSAKASIYAIRALFNMVFAFTNSEIRNETRSVGLMVQAATMGFVPYQIVQVVLQLALAFAESAIDLSALSNGLSVVVVKSEETWNLSLKHATQIAGNYIAEKASTYASHAISTAGEALQKVVDSGVDDIADSVTKLSKDLGAAARNEITTIVGQGFEFLENKLFNALDKISLHDYTGYDGTVRDGIGYIKVPGVDEVTGIVEEYMNSAITEFSNGLGTELTGIPLADNTLVPLIREKGVAMGEKFRDEVVKYVKDNYVANQGETCNVTTLICRKMNEWQAELTDQILNIFTDTDISVYITGKVNAITNEAKNTLDGYISGVTNDLSEQAAAQIKDNVTNFTNGFIDKYIPSQSSSNVGNSLAGGKNSESLSSIIKLSYKDYLMLFAFIEICFPEGSDKILARVSDVIQMNIQHASEGGTFKHKKGKEFLMKNAFTYVGIDAKVDLNMLFIDMYLFRRTFDDGSGTYDTALSKYGIVDYTGLQGY